jgi:hypothetical protein
MNRRDPWTHLNRLRILIQSFQRNIQDCGINVIKPCPLQVQKNGDKEQNVLS